MTGAIYQGDIIDDVVDLEKRVGRLEIRTGPTASSISAAAIAPPLPGSVSGGYDPTTGTTVPSSIIAGSIIATQLYSGTIDAYKITADNIKTRTLTADRIVSGSITANEIAAHTITGNEMNVSSLSAITATMGDLSINGTLTIATAGKIKTQIGNQATEFTSAGFKSYDVTTPGSPTFNLSSSTGILTARMVVQTGTQMPLGFIGGGNLLPDSSFEGANAGTIYNGANSTIAPAVISGGSFHGLKAMQVTSLAAGTFDVRHFSNRVKVSPGKYYTATVYVMPSSASGSVQIYLDTYNSSGVRVAATASTPVAFVSNTWTRISITKLAEATADTAQIIVQASATGAGQVFYVDAAQLEVGEIATAYAPRPDEVLPGSITVNELSANSVSATQIQTDAITSGKILAGSISASKISAIVAGGNLVDMATTSFEQDLTGWTTVGGDYWLANGATATRDTSQSYFGSASMKIVTTASASGQGARTALLTGPFRAGVVYSTSFYVYGSGNSMTAMLTDGGVASTSDLASKSFTASSGWQKVSFSWTPASDRATAVFAIKTNTAVVSTTYFDGLQVEQGDVPTAWKQYISAAVIEGSTITGAVYRTNSSSTRVQIDDSGGLQTYNAGVLTSQIKAGLGGFDLTSTNYGGGAIYDYSARKIRWLDGASKVMGSLSTYGSSTDSSGSAVSLTGASNSTYPSDVRISANRTSASTELRVSTDYGLAQSISANFGSAYYLAERVIADNNGASNFLQIGSNGGPDLVRKSNCFTASATTSGAIAAGATGGALVAHGLPNTPEGAIAMTIPGGNTTLQVVSVSATTSTLLVVNLRNTSGASIPAGTAVNLSVLVWCT